MKENPSEIRFQSFLSVTLNNLSSIHLDSNLFAEALDPLREAIKYQKAVLQSNPQYPFYREVLKNQFMNLVIASNGLNDASIETEALQGLRELVANDPMYAELEQRLKAVSTGEVAKYVGQNLTVGRWAYELQQYSLATKLYSDAF